MGAAAAGVEAAAEGAAVGNTMLPGSLHSSEGAGLDCTVAVITPAWCRGRIVQMARRSGLVRMQTGCEANGQGQWPSISGASRRTMRRTTA